MKSVTATDVEDRPIDRSGSGRGGAGGPPGDREPSAERSADRPTMTGRRDG